MRVKGKSLEYNSSEKGVKPQRQMYKTTPADQTSIPRPCFVSPESSRSSGAASVALSSAQVQVRKTHHLQCDIPPDRVAYFELSGLLLIFVARSKSDNLTKRASMSNKRMLSGLILQCAHSRSCFLVLVLPLNLKCDATYQKLKRGKQLGEEF